MRSWSGVLLSSALLLGGCGDAGDSGTGTTGAGGGSATSSAAATSGATTGGSSTSSGTGVPDVPGVVINEISAKGGDWIELGNSADTAADLGGYGLCDSNALGVCNLLEIVRFPAGTTLAPGEHLLIVGNKAADAGVGPFTDCLATGGPSTCFYAPWKVSASKGEKVHYVGPDNVVINEVNYPINAVPDGETWGRIPDLTGALGANAPTPGTPNIAK